MHRSRLAGFIIDCKTDDLEGAAAFWGAALGAERGEAEGAYVSLTPQSGLYAAVQEVEHPSRVHLDVETDDIPAEVARLEKLGASKVAEVKAWVVMQAPTGHRFCVVPAGTADFAVRGTVWEDGA